MFFVWEFVISSMSCPTVCMPCLCTNIHLDKCYTYISGVFVHTTLTNVIHIIIISGVFVHTCILVYICGSQCCTRSCSCLMQWYWKNLKTCENASGFILYWKFQLSTLRVLMYVSSQFPESLCFSCGKNTAHLSNLNVIYQSYTSLCN